MVEALLPVGYRPGCHTDRRPGGCRHLTHDEQEAPLAGGAKRDKPWPTVTGLDLPKCARTADDVFDVGRGDSVTGDVRLVVLAPKQLGQLHTH
ncbi:MAG: hypothetical protein M1134_05280 [Actinobacteria bacterium]|nr:hypothetical protein [Actinomycetota bacterium]